MKHLFFSILLLFSLAAKSQCDTMTSATFTAITTNSVNVSFTVSGSNWSSFNVTLYDSITGAVAFNNSSLFSTSFVATGLLAGRTYLLRTFTIVPFGGCEPNVLQPRFRTLANIGYTPMNGNGYLYKRIAVDSTFHVPLQDTGLYKGILRAGAIVCRPQDSSFWGWNGAKWKVFSSGGSYQATSTGIIGDIYNKSIFPNLSDFSTNAGFTASSNKINATASDNSYSNYLRLNYATALDNYNLSATYKYTASAASDSGLRVALWGSGTSCGVYLNPVTRRVTGYMSYGSTKYFSNEQLPSISTGDSLKVSLSWVRGLIITTATNFTTGNTIVDTLPSLFLSGASTISGIVSNTAYPTLYPGNATYQICSFRYSSGEFSNVPLVALGNSITRTSYTTSAAGRYGEQIGAVIWAAPGDATYEVLDRLPEFRDYIKGKNVTMMIGGNDLAASLSDTANFKIRYKKIVDSLTSYGVLNIIHLLPTPRTGYPNMFWLQGWLKSTYPNKYIDTYTALLGSGTDMNSIYNSGDNVHPNQLGHDKIANTIISSPLYQNLVNLYGFNQVLQRYLTGATTNDTTLATLGTVKSLLQNFTATSTGGGGTVISGTVNKLPKFNATGDGLIDSDVSDDGTYISLQNAQISTATDGGLGLNYNNGKDGILGYYAGTGSEKFKVDKNGDGNFGRNLTILGNYTGVDASLRNIAMTGTLTGGTNATFSNYVTGLEGRFQKLKLYGLVDIDVNPATGDFSFNYGNGNFGNTEWYGGSGGLVAKIDRYGNFTGNGLTASSLTSSGAISGTTGTFIGNVAGLQGQFQTLVLNSLARIDINGTSGDFGLNYNNSNTGRFQLFGGGTVAKYEVDSIGNVFAKSFVKTGGTSSQILAADGSVITAGTGVSIVGGEINVTSQVFSGSASTVLTAQTTIVVTVPTQSNNTYQIFVQPTSDAAMEHPFKVANKTTTSFDIVFKNNVTGTVTFDWLLKP